MAPPPRPANAAPRAPPFAPRGLPALRTSRSNASWWRWGCEGRDRVRDGGRLGDWGGDKWKFLLDLGGPPFLSPPARCPSPQWGHRHHGQLHGKHTFTGFPQRAAAGNGLSEEEGTGIVMDSASDWALGMKRKSWIICAHLFQICPRFGSMAHHHLAGATRQR